MEQFRGSAQSGNTSDLRHAARQPLNLEGWRRTLAERSFRRLGRLQTNTPKQASLPDLPGLSVAAPRMATALIVSHSRGAAGKIRDLL